MGGLLGRVLQNTIEGLREAGPLRGRSGITAPSQRRPQLVPYSMLLLQNSKLRQGARPLNPAATRPSYGWVAYPLRGCDLEPKSSFWLRAIPAKGLI